MRRQFIGSIFALTLAWASLGHASAQARAELPPVREVSIGEPAFDIFGRADGLQSTQLFDLYSDPHGFIWLAGDRGVHRFDGHTFFNLDRDPGRTDTLDSRYNYLVAPSRQAVWIIAPHATLQVLDSSTGKLAHLAVRGASLKDIEWLEADARGDLWYLSPEGVIHLDRTGKAVRVIPSAQALVFSPDRKKLYGVLADRVLAIDTQSSAAPATVFKLPGGFEGPIVRTTADNDGLWLAVDHGFWRLEFASGDARFAKMPFALSMMTGLVRDSSGVLWFGDYNGILHRYDPRRGELSRSGNNPDDP